MGYDIVARMMAIFHNRESMKRDIVRIFFFGSFAVVAQAAPVFTAHSPDSGVVAVVRVEEKITYEVYYDGVPVLEPSTSDSLTRVDGCCNTGPIRIIAL